MHSLACAPFYSARRRCMMYSVRESFGWTVCAIQPMWSEFTEDSLRCSRREELVWCDTTKIIKSSTRVAALRDKTFVSVDSRLSCILIILFFVPSNAPLTSCSAFKIWMGEICCVYMLHSIAIIVHPLSVSLVCLCFLCEGAICHIYYYLFIIVVACPGLTINYSRKPWD